MLSQRQTKEDRDYMTATIQNIDTSAELPIEQLYNSAVTGYIQAHTELAKLPADKNNPLPSLDASLRSLGVERDNDASMFVMGGVEQIAMGALANAFGFAAHGAAATAIDVASSIVSEADNDNARKTKFKRKGATTKSVFQASAKFKSVPAVRKAPAAFATSIMKNQLQARRVRLAADRRKKLMALLEKRRAEIELLDVFKKSGYKFVRRMNMMGANGQTTSMLIPVEGSPKAALVPGAKKVDLANTQKPSFRGPSLGMAA